MFKIVAQKVLNPNANAKEIPAARPKINELNPMLRSLSPIPFWSNRQTKTTMP